MMSVKKKIKISDGIYGKEIGGEKEISQIPIYKVY